MLPRVHRAFLSSNPSLRMALPPAPVSRPPRLIFAPAGSKTNAQAEQYQLGTLDARDLSPDPLDQFRAWFSAAQAAGVSDPQTACFSTAALPSGRVTSRFVYMKEVDDRGFVVYSNWGTSQKSKDVATNAWASLAFWWKEAERQVRIEGRIERLSREESQRYYDTRVRGSRIGAWASRQSGKIGSREVLEEWVREAEERFGKEEGIPCPEFWGGVRIVPERMEFWQGRDSRLHDRFEYVRKEGEGEEGWEISRLSP